MEKYIKNGYQGIKRFPKEDFDPPPEYLKITGLDMVVMQRGKVSELRAGCFNVYY